MWSLRATWCPRGHRVGDPCSKVFPSLSCTCIGRAGQGLRKHSDELLHLLWFAGHTCVDTMSAFFLGMMHQPGLEIHHAVDKGDWCIM